MARLRDVVFDCRHPASLARFWAAALDDYVVAPYDDGELARLRRLGIQDPADDPTVLVVPKSDGPRLWFQRVPEEKYTKNRVHFDLACVENVAESELARLESLGAARAQEQPNHGLVVMYDPEGNEFCLLLR